MAWFRVGHRDRDEDPEYVEIDFKDKRTYLLFYHILATFTLGWPAHWAKKLADKHEKWIMDEYHIQIFRKRLDEDPPI